MSEDLPKKKISLVKNYCNKEMLEQRERLKDIDYNFKKAKTSKNRRYEPEPFLLKDFNEQQIENINNYELRCRELDTIGRFNPETVKKLKKMPDDSFPQGLKYLGEGPHVQR